MVKLSDSALCLSKSSKVHLDRMPSASWVSFFNSQFPFICDLSSPIFLSLFVCLSILMYLLPMEAWDLSSPIFLPMFVCLSILMSIKFILLSKTIFRGQNLKIFQTKITVYSTLIFTILIIKRIENLKSN